MTCPCTTAADIISTVATIQPGDACGFAGAQAAMARHGRLPSCCGTQKVGAAAKNPKPSYSRVIEMHIQALSRAGALSTPGKIRGDDEVRLLKASLAFFSEKKGRDSTGRQPDEGSLAAKFVALRDLAGAPVRLPKAALLVSTRIDQMVVAGLPDDTTTIGTLGRLLAELELQLAADEARNELKAQREALKKAQQHGVAETEVVRQQVAAAVQRVDNVNEQMLALEQRTTQLEDNVVGLRTDFDGLRADVGRLQCPMPVPPRPRAALREIRVAEAAAQAPAAPPPAGKSAVSLETAEAAPDAAPNAPDAAPDVMPDVLADSRLVLCGACEQSPLNSSPIGLVDDLDEVDDPFDQATAAHEAAATAAEAVADVPQPSTMLVPAAGFAPTLPLFYLSTEENDFALIMGEPLGAGEFGTVFTAVSAPLGSFCNAACATAAVAGAAAANGLAAAKVFVATDDFEREVSVLSVLSGMPDGLTYISGMIDTFVPPLTADGPLHFPSSVLFTELATHGTLQQLMMTTTVPKPAIKLLVVQINEALTHLMNLFVAHGDLKPANVLLTCPLEEILGIAHAAEAEPLVGLDGFTSPREVAFIHSSCIKLCDFGLSTVGKEATEECDNRAGTVQYMSPEVIIAGSSSVYHQSRADVWSLGVIMHEMLTGGNHPFMLSPEDTSLAQRLAALAELHQPPMRYFMTDEYAHELSDDHSPSLPLTQADNKILVKLLKIKPALRMLPVAQRTTLASWDIAMALPGPASPHGPATPNYWS